MKIIVGQTAGFCGGVKNAVTKAEEIVRKEQEIFCLGSLVHNEEIIKKLEKQGLVTIHNIEEAKRGSKVIIRAHGEPPETYQKAKENNLEIIDLTCPKVLAIHEQAQKYEKEGTTVLYIAEGNHPETQGTMGYLKKAGILVQSEEEIAEAVKKVLERKTKKIATLAQTTFSAEKFDKIIEKIKQALPQEIEVNKTICNATKIRQEETENMIKQVDAMIIIGGKNSSNTRKIYDIANGKGKPAYLVQTSQDLDESIYQYATIGIMAGASTPQYLIDEVNQFLLKKDERNG